MSLNQTFNEQISTIKNIHQSHFGIRAKDIDINSLPNHIKPEQIRDEIPTLNQTGYMKFELEYFSQSFIDYATESKKPVLEIGTAYGWLTHKVLETGSTVVASDICKEHLEVLLKDTKKEHLDRLYIYQGAFPDQFSFPKESFDAILASRVLHFLDGETLERGLDKIYDWLTPGGKFIATNCSMFHSSVKNIMNKIFEPQ